jgi:hypothetical protein
VDWLVRIERMLNAIEKAKKLGTYDALDRSRQYEGITEAERDQALNEAWTKIRICEKKIEAKEKDIKGLREQLRQHRIVNVALTAIITVLASEGLKALLAFWLHR